MGSLTAIISRFIVSPSEDHGGRYKLTPDIYIGLYDDVDDLLDHCVIDGKTLREIIPSEETRICSID